MFEVFLLTLRELAELLLIVDALNSYLHRSGRAELNTHVIRGTLAGVALGVTLTLVLVAVAAPLDPRVQALITIAFALGVLALASGMFSSARVIRSRLHASLDMWIESSHAPLAVMGLAAFMALRETLEVTLFVHAMGHGQDPGQAIYGVMLGTAGAGLLALAYRSIQARIGLLAAFRLSAMVLSLLVIQLLLKGMGALLSSYATVSGSAGWVTLLTPFLEGGEWHGWACLSLMLFPATLMARQWWFETEAAR